jgi:lipoate-protein ligase A
MQLCDLTLPTPEENLACDEALLDLCEAGGAGPLLRLWEPAQYFVALGYANHAAREVNLPFCQANAIPVLRRCTGGGAVLQGPGVLNYSLILPHDPSGPCPNTQHATRNTQHDPSGPCHSIAATNAFVLERHRAALTPLLSAPVERQGQTDLTLGGLKFSGNAQRRHRRCLIFHGSFLLNLDFDLLGQALPLPSRQPAYRANRSHADFLVNLKLPAPTLKLALRQTWNATQPLPPIPFHQIALLAREKYSRDEWNLKC